DHAFDRVVCNSVLEYVEAADLQNVQRELDRVLRPGGCIYVTATSNRLWPRESHSRRWFSNYVPGWLDAVLAPRRGLQRGIWPWQVRYGFGDYENSDWSDGGAAYLQSHRAM